MIQNWTKYLRCHFAYDSHITLTMTPTGVTYDAHNDINDDAYTTTHDSHIDTILHTMVSSLATMKHELRLPTDK